MKPLATPIAALVGAALLAACGGGDVPAPVSDTVPPSATASTDALAQWAGAQAEDDTREPLRLDGVELPSSETAEPAPLAR